jgi:hypothetical protein
MRVKLLLFGPLNRKPRSCLESRLIFRNNLSCDGSCDMKLKPLQIWFPRIGGSIKRPQTSRDSMRAFELWRDELVIWMLPEIHKPARWRINGIGNLAVPAEEFERIDVVHVTEQGCVYAPTAKGIMPDTIEGLLRSWLNLPKSGGVSFVRPLDSITVDAPFISSRKKVSSRKRTVSFGPGAYLPIIRSNRKKREATMVWPPKGAPAPVSPEAESALRFPSKKLTSDPPTVVTDQGDVASRVFLRWPGQLETMMPLLSGVDDLLAQAQMTKLAGQSTSDLAGALRRAAVSAQSYVFPGHTTVEHIWFRPTLEQKGASHVLFKAEERGLIPPRRRSDQASIDEALKKEAWQKWLAEPVSIRRVWGAIGLFWTLLLDHLEAQRKFAVCELCSGFIVGKEGKRFCGKEDDAECFKRRRTVDKRRSRLPSVRVKCLPSQIQCSSAENSLFVEQAIDRFVLAN